MNNSDPNPGKISPASIRIKNPPGQGGEGGEKISSAPPSPPWPRSSVDPKRPVTNAEFMSALFPSIDDGEMVAVCSKPGDPTNGPWPAKTAENVDQACPPTANNYFNCSTFTAADNGSLSAKSENFCRYHVLVFDDVGTKVPLDKVAHIEPTYVIETSRGNFQYGFVLATPIADKGAMTRLQNACAEAGLTDNGAKGAARWMRLPDAINGKAKHHDLGGQPFQCRLTKWNPDISFSEEQLFTGFHLTAASTVSPASNPVNGNRPRKRAHSVSGISHEVFTPASGVNPVVECLTMKGHYKRDEGHGQHAITCPWVDEHTDQLDDGTVYFEPSDTYPQGGFKCHHGHCANRSVGDLLNRLEIDDDIAQHRPIIHIIPGTSDQSVLAAESVLASTRDVFQMGGAIVYLHHGDIGQGASIERACTSTLTLRLSRSAIWKRKSKEGWNRCNPPADQVKMLLESTRYGFLPTLTGLARQSYYRPTDNVLVTQPGFDATSGIYGIFAPSNFCVTEPSYQDAKQALREIEQLLCEFRFVSEADKATAISAMMTAAVRPSLPVAPAFLTTAPDSGVGKSYLTQVITAFAGGEPKRVSFPRTSDEATKQTVSMLLSAPAVIEYDDMDTDFRAHVALNRLLTSETMDERILGSSKTAKVSTRCFVIGSGNNVRPTGDMQRRVMTIKLAARDEEGIGRKFNGRPADDARDNRDKYLGCIFTIIEAWKHAGSPKADVPDIASYSGPWSDYCRHPLIWLGLPDPATSIFEQVGNDPERVLVGKLLAEWLNEFGNSAIPSRKVTKFAYAYPDSLLVEILQELPIYDGSSINRSKFGQYLSRQAGKVIGGLKLTQCDADGRNGWRVDKAAKVATPPTPPAPGAAETPDDLEPEPRG
jgi:hypothetical protein